MGATPTPQGSWRVAADGWVLATAIGVWAAALRPDALPTVALHTVWSVVVLGVIAALRRPRTLLLGLVLLAGARTAATVDHLASARDGPVVGVATVVADGERRGAAATAEIELAGFRWQLWAHGGQAHRLAGVRVGERYEVWARGHAAAEGQRHWLWPRGVVGRAEVDVIVWHDSGRAPYRLANWLRGLIDRSTASLSPRDATLVRGFVYGDDRGQLPEVVDDFRATGLTHLLAVSGSNVAMVLVLVRPLLQRLPSWGRLTLLLMVLGQFAVLTRGEPSVLRAVVLAGLAAWSVTVGRPASSLRLLALAVIGLLIYNPMLARSVGFQLSVAASLGIMSLAPHLGRVLRGPRWLVEPLAVTSAAQLGVLPVQVATFGSLPLVSLPANLLAGPAAGPAMVWGLTAGMSGGVMGEPFASWLHVPSRLLMGWVAGVARHGATVDLPLIEPDELLPIMALVALTGVWWWRRPRQRRRAVLLAAVVIVMVARGDGSVGVDDPHLWLVAGEPTVVVVDRPDPAWALGQLRRAGVDHIDVLVSRSGSSAAMEAVRVIRTRVDVDEVWVPPSTMAAATLGIDSPRALGNLVISPSGERLNVAPRE